MSAIEALASGTPVVATRVGGVPDVVRDGIDGFLVEPGDTEAAAERLAELALDPELRARLGESGRAYVRERYSVERLVDDVDRLYRSLLAAKGLVTPLGRQPPVAPRYVPRKSASGVRSEDLEVDARRAVLDVPDVELDALGPGQLRAAVHLRPPGEPGPDVEPVALVLVVLLDLVAQRRPRADDAHVAAQDVPELRELVDRRPPQDAPDARDPAVALVDRVAGAHASRPRRPSCGASAPRSPRRPCRRASGGRARGRDPRASSRARRGR